MFQFLNELDYDKIKILYPKLTLSEAREKYVLKCYKEITIALFSDMQEYILDNFKKAYQLTTLKIKLNGAENYIKEFKVLDKTSMYVEFDTLIKARTYASIKNYEHCIKHIAETSNVPNVEKLDTSYLDMAIIGLHQNSFNMHELRAIYCEKYLELNDMIKSNNSGNIDNDIIKNLKTISYNILTIANEIEWMNHIEKDYLEDCKHMKCMSNLIHYCLEDKMNTRQEKEYMSELISMENAQEIQDSNIYNFLNSFQNANKLQYGIVMVNGVDYNTTKTSYKIENLKDIYEEVTTNDIEMGSSYIQ